MSNQLVSVFFEFENLSKHIKRFVIQLKILRSSTIVKTFVEPLEIKSKIIGHSGN